MCTILNNKERMLQFQLWNLFIYFNFINFIIFILLILLLFWGCGGGTCGQRDKVIIIVIDLHTLSISFLVYMYWTKDVFNAKRKHRGLHITLNTLYFYLNNSRSNCLTLFIYDVAGFDLADGRCDYECSTIVHLC